MNKIYFNKTYNKPIQFHIKNYDDKLHFTAIFKVRSSQS